MIDDETLDPKLTIHYLLVTDGDDELRVWFDLKEQFFEVQTEPQERQQLLELCEKLVHRGLTRIPPPVPPATEVNFLKALDAAFQDGKKIKRTKWINGTHGVVKDGQLMIKIKENWHTWILHEADYKADDWEVMQ